MFLLHTGQDGLIALHLSIHSVWINPLHVHPTSSVSPVSSSWQMTQISFSCSCPSSIMFCCRLNAYSRYLDILAMYLRILVSASSNILMRGIVGVMVIFWGLGRCVCVSLILNGQIGALSIERLAYENLLVKVRNGQKIAGNNFVVKKTVSTERCRSRTTPGRGEGWQSPNT